MSNLNPITTKALIESGLALVPVPLGEKGPNHPRWNTRDQCVTAKAQLPRLTGKNIGIAHAFCSPTATCALDVDSYKTAKDWLATHNIDLKKLLSAPDAVVIWSGKKYSLKLLYKLPTGRAPLESKKINDSDGKCALEFRCASRNGLTLQDLLPPSIHPEGRKYQWMGAGDPLHPPVIPIELLKLWDLLVRYQSRVDSRDFGSFQGHHRVLESPRQIATVKAALNYISADCPYESWRNICWAILSTGWACAEDIALHWSKTAENRFDEEAFWLLVQSFLPNHPSAITIGTVFHFARQGGWDGK